MERIEPSKLPDWALNHAQLAFNMGMQVPAIEQQLIARGMSPETATAVTNHILENKLHQNQRLIIQRKRSDQIHQVASLIVAGICVLLAHLYGEEKSVGITLRSLILPLACICFPMSKQESFPEYRYILRWGGWVVLILILGYRILLLSLANGA